MASLWTIDEICRATGAPLGNLAPDREIFGVSIDSRTVAAHDLFVAIKGDQFDGHDFVVQALEKGAGAALVNAKFAQAHPEIAGLLVVDDALQGLEQLGMAARARVSGHVIAVTGSVGKTSTKEAVRITLEQFGKTHYSIKSFNNHWGLPLMLARMPADTDYGVFELGMNHADEIRHLVAMVRPHMAVITKIAAAHLENFPDLYGIADAKAEIFEGLEPNGQIFLGADHDYLPYLQGRAAGLGRHEVTTYGFAPGADLRLGAPKLADGQISSKFCFRGNEGTLLVPQLGAHALPNAACAYLIGRAFDLNSDSLIEALRAYVAPPGRGEVLEMAIDDSTFVLVDESYNANPSSMQAALDTLAQTAHQGRICVILGDMLELGEKSPELHRALATPILTLGPAQCFLVGPMMAHLRDELDAQVPVDWAENREGLLSKLANWLAPGDLVMVKGSNGIGLGALVQACREKWPPVKV